MWFSCDPHLGQWLVGLMELCSISLMVYFVTYNWLIAISYLSVVYYDQLSGVRHLCITTSSWVLVIHWFVITIIPFRLTLCYSDLHCWQNFRSLSILQTKYLVNKYWKICKFWMTDLSHNWFVTGKANSFESCLNSLFVHFLLQVSQHVIQSGVYWSLCGWKSAIPHPKQSTKN